MRIYTGGGDRGKTSLFSGERVSKDHVRIEAYGDVDELNSFLGAIAGTLPPGAIGLREEIGRLQSDLFVAGAWLATTPESPAMASLQPFGEEPAERLERAIDRLSEELPELKSFILPGGDLSAAFAHISRTVCRRAERHVIRLSQALDMDMDTHKSAISHIIIYLNRLSDYLFVLARQANRLAGIREQTWVP